MTMARASFACGFLLILACGSPFVSASDPELLTDFSVPEGKNASCHPGSFFTFTGFRNPAAPPSGKFQAIEAFVDAFPALNGLDISAAFLSFQCGSLNAPHTHPRGTELLYLIDSTNKMLNQTLQKGDVFVFPKGLVHFQMNASSNTQAHALAVFSSGSPGTVSLPATLFGSRIPERVLTEAFNIQLSTSE